MDVVAKVAAECGAVNIGVLPRFMKGLEHPDLTELVWTDTMSERKELMRDGVTVAVALPGGIGTLDEIIETLVLRKLNRYGGKVIALNIDGFYNPFKALLDHYVATNMLEERDRALIEFPETIDEFKQLL